MDQDFKIFSELLKFLRDSKNLKMLMTCRQIKNLKILNNQISIIADDQVLDEVCQNEEFAETLKNFFSKYNLSFKIDRKKGNISNIEILKEWLGDKLIIK